MFIYKKSLFVFSILLMMLFFNFNCFASWEETNGIWHYLDNEGNYETDTMRKSNDDFYYLDENGDMVKDFLLVDYNGETYYFGKDGKMVRDTWVAVDPSILDEENELAIWFYFQNSGKAYKSKDGGIKRTTIDGKSYIFNEKGYMQTGFIGNDGSININDEEYPYKDTLYYADVYGVLKKGWIKYQLGTDEERHEDKEVFYMYFNEKNYKKIYAESGEFKEKTINGKRYAFDEHGIMLSGWQYFDEYHESSASNIRRYYGQESDGALVKKGWVYTVPSEFIDESDFADEKPRYFYFDNSGTMITNMRKKIDGNIYVFDDKGIMKTGLVIFSGTNYESYIDVDWTSKEMLTKYGKYYASEKNYNDGIQTDINLSNNDFSILYFNENGEKKTGKKQIEFSDDTATFVSDNHSGFSGKKKKYYYSNGILLQAKQDLKFGIAVEDDDDARIGYEWRNDGNDDYTIYYYDDNFDLKKAKVILLTTTGKKKKKGVYKDSEDNYWVVDKSGLVKNVFSVKVKQKQLGDKTVYMYEDDKASKSGQFVYFSDFEDDYREYCENTGQTVDEKLIGTYIFKISANAEKQVLPNDDSILNFYLD